MNLQAGYYDLGVSVYSIGFKIRDFERHGIRLLQALQSVPPGEAWKVAEKFKFRLNFGLEWHGLGSKMSCLKDGT